VLDYVNGGELFNHLRRHTMFSEHDARFYVSEVGEAAVSCCQLLSADVGGCFTHDPSLP
jgi:hypothetical protein